MNNDNITFELLDLGWEAEPNAPDLQVKTEENDIIITFECFSVSDNATARIVFKDCVQYRVGSPNDEGFYIFGESRFKKYGVEWGKFYIVHNSNWQDDFPDAVKMGAEPENKNHYLFYFKDETFECIASSFDMNIIKH